MKKLLGIGLLFLASTVQAAVYTSTSTVWYVHVNGSTMAAGGFDPGAAVTTCGTNYADQDSTQAYLTDLKTNVASDKSLSSLSANFDSTYLCNSVLISTQSAGTNFTNGVYFITKIVTSTAVIVDRAVSTAGGAGANGVGYFGGAWKDPTRWVTAQAASGVALPAEPIAVSPAQTIMVQGSGSLDGSTTDYTWPSYNTWVAGNTTTGPIKITGYNGRPYIVHNGLMANVPTNWVFSHLKLVDSGSGQRAAFNNTGISGGITDCIIDANGNGDVHQLQVTISGGEMSIWNNEFRNSGIKTAGTAAKGLLGLTGYAIFAHDNWIHDGRTDGIYMSGTMSTVYNNIISSNALHGIEINSGNTYANGIINNTIDGNYSDGVHLDAVNSIAITTLSGNLITNNGAYGLNIAAGTAQPNWNLTQGLWDYNDYYGNATSAYHNMSAGAHDQTLNPNYSSRGDTTSSNWTPTNTSLNVGWPMSWINSATVGYPWIGAVTPQSTSGSGGTKGWIFSQ